MKNAEAGVSLKILDAMTCVSGLARIFVPASNNAAARKYEFSEHLSLVLHDCNLFSKIFLSLLTFFFLKATRENARGKTKADSYPAQ